jgi:hypothetical protein
MIAAAHALNLAVAATIAAAWRPHQYNFGQSAELQITFDV